MSHYLASKSLDVYTEIPSVEGICMLSPDKVAILDTKENWNNFYFHSLNIYGNANNYEPFLKYLINELDTIIK